MSNTIINKDAVHKCIAAQIEFDINELADKMVEEVIERKRIEIRKMIMNAAAVIIKETYQVELHGSEILIRVEHKDIKS